MTAATGDATTGSLFGSIFAGAGVKSKKKAQIADSDLDSIFRNSAGPSSAHSIQKPIPTRNQELESGAKQLKRKTEEATNSKPFKRSRQKAQTAQIDEQNATKKSVTAPVTPCKDLPLSSDSEEDSEDDALEEAYLSRKQKLRQPADKPPSPAKASANHSSSEDEIETGSEGGDMPLVHETKDPASSKKRQKGTKKYVKSDETEAERDRRTVFVGNLPVDVVKSKTSKKALMRHFMSSVPTCKIESLRLRSIAFQNPTSELPKEDGDGSAKKKNKKEVLDANDSSRRDQREAERVTRWQADHQAENANEKVYLQPKEKKRIAYIKKEIHDEAGSVNAYIVFAHPDPERSVNVPSILDPFEAAQQAISKCDGSEFMGRIIRVDRIRAKEGNSSPTISGSDPKVTVFVGSLDFAAKEQDLRAFFETLLTKEVGPVGTATGKDSWVKHVRIVRDSATQLGKGFAYVEFSDRTAVDEVLAMEETKLKFAKRKLRVQRCQTVPGSKAVKTVPGPKVSDSERRKAKKPEGRSHSKPAVVPIVVPKGDPKLGDKLKSLGKDERKAVKASDANRVARRLAKKKARNALAADGVGPKHKERHGTAKTRSKAAVVPKRSKPPV